MGKARIKLEGQSINSWYVEEYLGDMKYRCRCECGNICIITSKNLRNNISTRCRECYNKERQNKHKGKIFGYWEVLEYAGDKKQRCRCLKCGRIDEVYTESLVSGRSIQCKHCASSNGRKENNILEGKTFGSWYVNRYLGSGKYECICQCGTIRNIIGDNLKIGHIQQCSKCSGHELIDMKDKVVGDLKILDYVGDGKWTCQCKCGRTEVIHGYFLRNNQRTMCKACLDSGQSSEVEKHILKIFNKAEARNRSILCNKEIDIYLPDKKIGIEYNGNYWHSSEHKDKYYHYNKSKEASQKDVRIIHIFEYEWMNNRTKNILESMLKNINNDTREKLYSRKLKIREVKDSNIKKAFLEDNHLQGDAKSSINIGLFNEDELVSIMTFGSARFDIRDDTIELIRYCVKIDKIIVGGAERLFSYFCKNFKFKRVISYCDIGKFSGDIYRKLGFKQVSISEPNYVWVKNKEALKRYQTQKHKLLELGLGTQDQTEEEIMRSLGYMKVYDAGNLKFEYMK